MEPLQFSAQIYSDASSIIYTGCEGWSGKRMGNFGENTGMAPDKSQKTKIDGVSQSLMRATNSSTIGLQLVKKVPNCFVAVN